MGQVEETKYKIPFNAAVADPEGVDGDVLTELVKQYPYVQSLRVVQARRIVQEGVEQKDMGLPLMYVGAPYRLYALLQDAGETSDPVGMDGDDDEDILLVEGVDTAETEQVEPIGEWPNEAISEAPQSPKKAVGETDQIFHIDDPEAEAADQILEEEEMKDDDPLPTSVSIHVDGRQEEKSDDADEEKHQPVDSINSGIPPVAEHPAAFAIETVVPESHDAEQLIVNEDGEHAVTSGSDPVGEPDEVEAPDLLPEHPVGIDYLAYEERRDEQSSKDSADETASEKGAQSHGEEPVGTSDQSHEIINDQQIVRATQARPHEKVSVYDDEHMPYTFLWWLNKARMEHARTYQPYVQQGMGAGEPEDGGRTLLDQQIRENIFHLQPPEEKLTAGNKGQTVSFKVPKETDPIIERFIREEPQIKPPNPDKLTLKNMAKNSAEDGQEIVTETLAKIYADQGHYNKAIDAYKKLSLKYPEKSGYFAGRISDLEKKIF